MRCIACRYGLVRQENCSLCRFLAKSCVHDDILVELANGKVLRGHISHKIPQDVFSGKPLRPEDNLNIVVSQEVKIPDEPVNITNLWLKLA